MVWLVRSRCLVASEELSETRAEGGSKKSDAAGVRGAASAKKQGAPNHDRSHYPDQGAHKNSAWPTPPIRGASVQALLLISRALRLRLAVCEEAEPTFATSIMCHRWPISATKSSSPENNEGVTSIECHASSLPANPHCGKRMGGQTLLVFSTSAMMTPTVPFGPRPCFGVSTTIRMACSSHCLRSASFGLSP